MNVCAWASKGPQCNENNARNSVPATVVVLMVVVVVVVSVMTELMIENSWASLVLFYTVCVTNFCYCYGLLCIIMSIDLLAPVLCSHHYSHSLESLFILRLNCCSLEKKSITKICSKIKRKGPIFLFVSINIFPHYTHMHTYVHIETRLPSYNTIHRPSNQQITSFFYAIFGPFM